MPNECPDAVHVAFYRHARYESVLDALTSARLRQVSPRYEHCHVVFEWRAVPPSHEAVSVSFSTTELSPSLFVAPDYKDPCWEAVYLSHLRAPDRRRLFLWAQENEHAPFNGCAYYWNFLPPAICCSSACSCYDAEGRSFYCAEQVAVAMRVANAHPVFVHARTYRCTPDDVYDMLVRTARYTPVTIRIPPPPPPPGTVWVDVGDAADDGERGAGPWEDLAVRCADLTVRCFLCCCCCLSCFCCDRGGVCTCFEAESERAEALWRRERPTKLV